MIEDLIGLSNFISRYIVKLIGKSEKHINHIIGAWFLSSYTIYILQLIVNAKCRRIFLQDPLKFSNI